MRRVLVAVVVGLLVSSTAGSLAGCQRLGCGAASPDGPRLVYRIDYDESFRNGLRAHGERLEWELFERDHDADPSIT